MSWDKRYCSEYESRKRCNMTNDMNGHRQGVVI